VRWSPGAGRRPGRAGARATDRLAGAGARRAGRRGGRRWINQSASPAAGDWRARR
jgi:hypothetical protein